MATKPQGEGGKDREAEGLRLWKLPDRMSAGTRTLQGGQPGGCGVVGAGFHAVGFSETPTINRNDASYSLRQVLGFKQGLKHRAVTRSTTVLSQPRASCREA